MFFKSLIFMTDYFRLLYMKHLYSCLNICLVLDSYKFYLVDKHRLSDLRKINLTFCHEGVDWIVRGSHQPITSDVVQKSFVLIFCPSVVENLVPSENF